MNSVPQLTQEDIMKILGDNQNFLMLIKVLLTQRVEETVIVDFEDLKKVGPLGVRIQPMHMDEAKGQPKEIHLSLVAPSEKDNIISADE